MDMLTIDGSAGEGGGQILRTSVGLSLITGKAFRIYNVRARRKNPGLGKQHLTAVEAGALIGGAQLTGACVGSTDFTFVPQQVKPGEYTFNIGTAGSTMLVLQTVLPALMIADEPSRLVLEGGTHNPMAPPFEFIQKAFLPLLEQIGPKVTIKLERYGFYPPGGGKVVVDIVPTPTSQLRELKLESRGKMRKRNARVLLVKLPKHVGDRELVVLRQRLQLNGNECRIEESDNAVSPGNVVTISLESASLTEVITALGARGVSAESVAEAAVKETRHYLKTEAPVGEHLADQLLLPMALAGRGTYRTGAPSLHTTTNIETIRLFLSVDIAVRPEEDGMFSITLSS